MSNPSPPPSSSRLFNTSVSPPQPPPPPLPPQPEPQPQPEPRTTTTTTTKKKSSHHHLNNNNKPVKIPGTTILPATRVTRAAKQDKDIKIVSKEAVFLVSIATEFFIRKLTDSAFDQAKREKRVFVKYNDIASAVQNNPEYGWLEDVIPLSKPLGAVLADPMLPTASTAITNQLPPPLVPPKHPELASLHPLPSKALPPPADDEMELDQDEMDGQD